MTRDEAVARIRQGLGFVSSALATTIASRMDEAQVYLESGTTLPKFLLHEDQLITFTAGANSFGLPTGFLRIAGNEDNPIRYTPAGTTTPTFIKVARSMSEALEARGGNDPAGPQFVVIRKDSLYVLPTPDQDYQVTWSYYKSATTLTIGGSTNEWLSDTHGGAQWLIGMTGSLIAADSGNPRKALFDDMIVRARATLFGNIVEDEMASGPIMIGADN